MADSESNISWRTAVQQSYRNTEVREISRVLAALEPGASAASKLRLAMQFEDAVFKSATSLADYRKRLTKRLKKLQKNYVVTQPPVNIAQQADNKAAALHELRQTYGEALLYILENADKAVREMSVKHGDEKAKQLQQHTDGVKLWATDLGISLPSTTETAASSTTSPKPNVNMSDDQFERLKTHLQRRTENIRQHVLKLSDPDQFMAETLSKLQDDFSTKTRPNKLLADCTRRLYEHMHKNSSSDAQKLPGLTESMLIVQTPIPLVTNNRNQQEQDKARALLQLNKMRAASSALLAYVGMPDKSTVPRHTLMQVHKQVTINSLQAVQQVMQEQRQATNEPDVTLEDAWMKQPLVLPTAAAAVAAVGDVDGSVVESSKDEAAAAATATKSSPPPAKRPRFMVAVRSRVLLTARRKTPSNLILALKRKRARLVRPAGAGSHLILHFGQAFIMTIYFVPLVVTIRAASKGDVENDNWDDTLKGTIPAATATWTPLHHGLTDRSNVKGSSSDAKAGDDDDDKSLSLWGATGGYNTLGHLVEERLRDASAHATHVLRQCFAKAAHAKSDFETEILEATALLEFLQVARTTYMPNWQDDDRL